MNSEINENEGLLPAVVIVAVFGLALFTIGFLKASVAVFLLYLFWSVYATRKMELTVFKKLELKTLVLDIITTSIVITSLAATSFLSVSNFILALLGVLILTTTGLSTIIILDTRGQPASDFLSLV